MPLISVLMPVFNAEPFLEESIGSILGQSFKDFEFIIINDGSTDGSLRILREYQEKDSRIKIISRENRGLCATLNEGISIASGFWLARMDADDISLPNRFQSQLNWLHITNSEISGSFAETFGNVYKRRLIKHGVTHSEITSEMLFGTPFVHPTVIMKTEVAKMIPYNEYWEKAEDYDLWERILRTGHRMTNVPEVLLQYRIHNTQTTKVFSKEQSSQTHLIQLRYFEQIKSQLGITKKSFYELSKIKYHPSESINLTLVDNAASAILLKLPHSQSNFCLSQIYKLYLKAAMQHSELNILNHWLAINKAAGRRVTKIEVVGIYLSQKLKFLSKTRFFEYIKYLYTKFS